MLFATSTMRARHYDGATADDLKDEIAREHDIPVSHQRLFFGAEELESNSRLACHGITHDTSIILMWGKYPHLQHKHAVVIFQETSSYEA